jgi:heme/copper-type cytochrome/quinol oxidase subunit 2
LQEDHAVMFYFCVIMLTEDEKKFVEYWEIHRARRKKLLKQLAIGLPLSVTIVIAIFINFFSGWYRRADMELRSNSSLVIVLLVAALLIVIFMSVFSAKHQWDQNEQRYREFLAKKDKPA